PTPIAPSMSSMVRWWRIPYYKKYVLKIITQNSNSHLLQNTSNAHHYANDRYGIKANTQEKPYQNSTRER
ncbi:MAG: hypothetical protein ACI3YO_07835, partial [Prevotella sp.]